MEALKEDSSCSLKDELEWGRGKWTHSMSRKLNELIETE